MAAMARAAAEGGAAAIRCECPADIAAIRAAVALPLIGLWKVGDTGVYITPTVDAVHVVAAAGADMIAIDATDRPRLEPVAALIEAAHALGKLVLADCATPEEAVAAQAAGADAVAPTLAGYTGGPVPSEPAWALLEAMVRDCRVPVFMEGRIWSPAEARRALDLGAWAVVVGSAITRPQLITARFAEAVQTVV
ncbi:MAG: putative N-acetylmannosamine-6-phosphate 2-epimerase [Cyanobacteria bacterium RYN_339]|nr:putative N-acetylmannosamine-6-phosphate 2-epimerase [Cyanobacteria bacterium RYN_339]